jgi:hypothetical protein
VREKVSQRRVCHLTMGLSELRKVRNGVGSVWGASGELLGRLTAQLGRVPS